MRPAEPHTETLNVFERLGLRWMLGRTRSDRAALSHWPGEVLESIKKVERSTLIQAGFLGAASGALFGLTELGLLAWFGEDRGGATWSDQWPYWVMFAIFGLLISVAEIALLYWRILRAAGRVGTLAGLDMDRDDVERMIVLGMSRAALNMPNPRAEVHGVDPYSRLPRWKLIMYAVFYRLKVGATSMMVRLILRRIVARTAVRSIIPFAAIGVYAFWNIIITYWILRQARIRAAGPTALRDLDELTKEDCSTLEPSERQLLFKAVGETVILSQDAHPNYVLLLGQILDRCDLDADKIEGEWDIQVLRDNKPDDKTRLVLLRTLTTATILRGSPRKAQREFLAEVAEHCGHQLNRDRLNRVQKGVYEGQGVEASQLDAATPVTTNN